VTGLLLPPEALRALLSQVLDDRAEQGHVVEGLDVELAALPPSYDALVAFAEHIAELPLRADWAYVEPDGLEEIEAECDPGRAPDVEADAAAAAPRIETAWLARVAGCILGKPFEFDPTLEELRGVLEPAGEWPLRDYVSEATNERLRAPQPQWPECVRERIAHVPEDDDINYTVLALVLLEQHGATFTPDDLRRLWLLNLPLAATFGPERTQLLNAGLATLAAWAGVTVDGSRWTSVLNPADEHCGALIRADAYGYACPGRPGLAASLAHRDATLTHRRTGVYASMWVAAAVATALVSDDWRVVASTALAHVPQRSRLARIVADSTTEVDAATDWLDGYARIHGRYAAYTHCRVYQEIGTLLNTLRFADDVGHGLGLQVCQGNDTDSFGATAGSLLGALHGPGGFDRAHWIGPFEDRIHLALACVHETSLSALAERMSRLPAAR
jgi:ADP-ribosylglycohydrolase